jgi:DNA-binding winged helix-turn-helix (wHTH) protein/tetratricopeptide (TPR) repeat protein
MDGGGPGHEFYTFERFELDSRQRTLRRDGVHVALTPTVFDLLLCLIRRAGRIVTKDDLIDEVWRGRSVGDSTLSQTAYSLRRALADAGASERLIATVPGVGYTFESAVSVKASPPASRFHPPAADPSPIDSRLRRPLRWRLLASGALALAGAAATLVALRPKPHPPATAAPAVVVQAEFRNLTGDPVLDHTLSRVIEVDLGQSPGIEVLSTFRVADTLGQMGRSADQTLDPGLADQVCLRNNAMAVVEGGLAPVGHRYLVTLTATSCGGGRVLSDTKTLVDHREDVVPALDGLINRTRVRLGEGAASVRRFDTPLLQGRTASLDALRDYSEGVRNSDAGHPDEAIALLEHAVERDPAFAAAHFELARSAFNADRYAEARREITLAYAERNTVNESMRYSIDLDYVEALRLAKAATALYPDHWVGWSQLENLNVQLGRYEDAIVAGRRALALRPGREASYSLLAEALLDAGRFDEAGAVCDQAQARSLAGGMVARSRAALLLAEGDRVRFARIVADARGKPWESEILANAALAAMQLGEVHLGADLFAQEALLYHAAGQTDYFVGQHALALALMGKRDEALRAITPLPDDHGVTSLSLVNSLFALAETGEASRARSVLDRMLARGPRDTSLKVEFAPQARAALDLQAGHPSAAAADLAPAATYADRDDGVAYLRGRIDLALGDGQGAASAFRWIIDHPGIDPPDPRHSLAWLGLARAKRLAGDRVAAKAAYAHFLDLWKNADADIPLLKQARAEAASIG